MESKDKQKNSLHPRSRHHGKYDFDQLINVNSDLNQFVFVNKYGTKTVDFSDSEAVKQLNRTLLKLHYGVEFWDIPAEFLCPPIPGRADYIHYIADLMEITAFSKNSKVKVLDVGVGANLIYPLLGLKEYGWSFVGSDIGKISLESAQNIIDKNSLNSKIELRLQNDVESIFKGIVKSTDRFTITICNPPFHSSAEDAAKSTQRKLRNLTSKKKPQHKLNFGGQNTELWCKGGELAFIKKMIQESRHFAKNSMWFSSLVSKQANMSAIYKTLKKSGVSEIKTIEMSQGQKVSRIVVWSFV